MQFPSSRWLPAKPGRRERLAPWSNKQKGETADTVHIPTALREALVFSRSAVTAVRAGAGDAHGSEGRVLLGFPDRGQPGPHLLDSF